MSILDRPLNVTLFVSNDAHGRPIRSTLCPHGIPKRLALRSLGRSIKAVTRWAGSALPGLIVPDAQKFYLPLMSLSRFDGNYRNGENVAGCDGCEGDYDGQLVSMEDAAQRCEDAGIAAVFYPSPSWTAQKPRWRVLAPFSRARDPHERAAFLARLNGALGGILANESFSLGSSYFLGNLAPDAPAPIYVDGAAVDVREDLDATAIGKSETTTKPAAKGEASEKPPAIGEIDRDNINRDVHLKALAIECRRKSMSFEEFDAAWRENEIAADHVLYEKKGRKRSAKAQAHIVESIWKWAGEESEGSAYVDKFDVVPEPEGETTKPSAKPHPLSIAGMNEKYAVADMAGQSVIVVHRADRIDFTSKQALHDWHANKRRLVKDGDKEKAVSASVLWFASPRRKEYPNGVIFDPSGKGEDGALNLWTGWGVKANPGASCERILKHIREVISGGDAKIFDYNVKYDAHLVQRPREKPRVARVLRGTEGVGKDSYGRLIARIVGARHTAHIGDGERLTARFNSIFEAALFGWLEEAYFAGDKRERGKLYHLVTSPDVTIERKGLEAFQVESFLRLMMTTNESWAVPAGADARRFAVFDVAPTYKGSSKKSRGYFNALHAEIEGDGAGSYLAYLQDLDLTGFDITAIPQTRALDDQKRHSMPPLERWWERAIESGRLWEEAFGEGAVGKEALYGDYCESIRAMRFGGEPMGVVLFWKQFRVMCPGTREGRPRSRSDRKRQVLLPTRTTCNAAFERHIGVSASVEALIG